MKDEPRCSMSPDVLERLSFLEEHGIGTVDEYARAVTVPGPWYHLRVNTLKTRVDALLEGLWCRFPNETIKKCDVVPDAIKLAIRSGLEPTKLARIVEADKFAGESVLMSAPLYAPGFKSAKTRFKQGDTVSVVTSFVPSWGGGRRIFTCGNGIATRSSADMHEQASGIVVDIKESCHVMPRVQDWNEYRSGLLLDQNLPSMIASWALAPRPGERVLDACCGAGGKTTHIAQIARDGASILAIDRNAKRLERLEARAARMGITSIEAVRAKMERVSSIAGKQAFDKMLVDPPCSALGLRPKLYIDMNEKELDNFRYNQERIWGHVASVVKPGARCVHCTCTVSVEENEELVLKICDKLGFSIVDPGIRAGHPGIHVETMSRDESRKLLRFYPHLDGTIGFFIATLEKR